MVFIHTFDSCHACCPEMGMADMLIDKYRVDLGKPSESDFSKVSSGSIFRAEMISQARLQTSEINTVEFLKVNLRV